MTFLTPVKKKGWQKFLLQPIFCFYANFFPWALKERLRALYKLSFLILISRSGIKKTRVIHKTDSYQSPKFFKNLLSSLYVNFIAQVYFFCSSVLKKSRSLRWWNNKKLRCFQLWENIQRIITSIRILWLGLLLQV